jgi:hypothetical protein
MNMIDIQIHLLDHVLETPIANADVTITLKIAPRALYKSFLGDAGWEETVVLRDDLAEVFTRGGTSAADGTFAASFEIGQAFEEVKTGSISPRFHRDHRRSLVGGGNGPD